MPDHQQKGPFAAINAKFSKVFSSGVHAHSDTSSVQSSEYGLSKDADRSESRGRDQKAFQSSGRGGAGNIRLRSTSREPSTGPGPDDFSLTRGRTVEPTPGKPAHTGRGGAGNVRAPSADPAAEKQEAARERSIVAAKTEEEKDQPHSTGRGGFGNIDRSRSRSRNPDPVHHSSGKGGYGNITASAVPEEVDEEKERKAHHVPATHHSSGRGGAANVTAGEGPPIEALDKLKLSEGGTTGRGGAGNLID